MPYGGGGGGPMPAPPPHAWVPAPVDLPPPHQVPFASHAVQKRRVCNFIIL